uniref:Uncharacterized protein n=2 Tax=Canis lupus familiaris TaxID=9615 RepID=A0A8C0TZQ9_CANLF
VCLSVCPTVGLRQLKTPPVSHLMCGCEIPFEYCRSELMVAKGTASLRSPLPRPICPQHTAPAVRQPGQESCEFGLDLTICFWGHRYHWANIYRLIHRKQDSDSCRDVDEWLAIKAIT